MAYVLATASCFGCKRLFSFHPNKVPSIRVNDARQPICRACIERANPQRAKNGLPPIVPLPGAYEPAEEDEISWD